MPKDPKKDYLLRFGEKLKTLRTAKGLSLRALAALCSVDHSDIGKIENGEINITILTVLELATALEVKPRRLLDFE